MYQQFIVIRFSLAFNGKNMKPIRVTLATKRLRNKFRLFERICLPSLLRQRLKDNVLVIIKITNNLPNIWKNKLYAISNKYPDYIKIQEFNYVTDSYGDSLLNKHLEQYILPTTQYVVTTRMDDDDALNKNFTLLMKRYVNNQNNNKIISFPRGYVLDTIRRRYYPYRRKLLALGLSLIQTKDQYGKFQAGVYSGNHTKWHRKTKCIYPNNVMFIRTRSDTNDSKISNGERIRLARANKNLRLLRRQFPGVKI